MLDVRSHEKQKAIDKLSCAFHPKRQKGEKTYEDFCVLVDWFLVAVVYGFRPVHRAVSDRSD